MSHRSTVEILAIGDELLLGDTLDTNGAWLGRRLSAMGVVAGRRTVVGDDEATIRDALRAALGRAGIVICCGGLGPTPDDRTRDAAAAVYGLPFDTDVSWLAVIRERFHARGLDMPGSNQRQARVPRGAVLFPNPAGTAPGLAIEHPSLGLTILLPGPPRELHALFDEQVAPFLASRLSPDRGPVLRRVLRTTGLPESLVAERVSDLVHEMAPLTLAFLPVGIGTDLRITSWGELSEVDAERAIDRAFHALAERLGAAVYGEGDADLAAVVGQAIGAAGLTVATAESCTGGLAAKRLTDVPGASAWVLGGVVAYSNAMKQALLGVPASLLEAHGAVSEAVARAMVEGVRSFTGADCALAITGIAGPGGGTPEKPASQTMPTGFSGSDRNAATASRRRPPRHSRTRGTGGAGPAARDAREGIVSGHAAESVDGSFKANGLRLHYRAWHAPDPVAMLLIVHGLSDHGGRYEAVGRALAESGISSWALDQRGHGHSEGRRGHAPRFACLIEDLDAFRRVVLASAGPGTPLFLLGHSMGGLVAIRYVEEFPDAFCGAIVVSPWLATAVVVPRWKSALAVGLSRVVPALPFPAKIPAEHLSHDPAVVRAYREDPLVHDIITPRLFVQVRAAMEEAFDQADRIQTPMLVFLAGSDRIVDSARGLAFARSVPGGRVGIHWVKGAYHEILNEPDSARHVADISAWVLAQVSAASARAGLAGTAGRPGPAPGLPERQPAADLARTDSFGCREGD